MPQFALLALEDGSLFEGIAFGYLGQSEVFAVGEVVFNTAMTGYQEIITDPSYAGQLITLTYPHIGNVGINTDDCESNTIHAKGLIIRQLPLLASNWRQQMTLDAFMKEQKIVGITDIDTRRLTRVLRTQGALKGCIYTAEKITQEGITLAIEKARAFSGLAGLDLAIEVTTKAPYVWQEGGLWALQPKAPEQSQFHVVAYDFGIKKTILRCLTDAGCKVTVVPAKTPAQEVLALQPHGVFLSNGPGDPQACDYAITAIQHLLEKNIPIFGICLGHQLLALALQAKTHKMKFGHHGGNHPVKALMLNQVMITSQNHGFTVDDNALPECIEVTHRSLFDGTIQGIKHRSKPAFGFQGHPEAGPGPNDVRGLFAEFVTMMQNHHAIVTANELETV
ncbi:glutamine-hydrolyzing carbamoyl-phosphate synthase small subunit [Candidatus Berkiella aquae]|uniref:Carbamoyl phosphate synthase small chain n=1 Tax=Candidatus Berkiella aquae TaxID=295108 RepID=A0A0Q9YM52_9GAMM|nr:glutamine-hydrolyzing carbamoyl-phosphate synthase small subunit [Candidatus Berkiella aquae]MCS5710472.1 glutamine-hydrolyzing carbamoyl-phosphate synthase small subunit [Candidatus Berkiella aquae]